MICPTCGYEPMEGRDGFHSCKQQLQAKEIVEYLKDILKPIPKDSRE